MHNATDIDCLTAALEFEFAGFAGADASHDVHHARRVKQAALEIADIEDGAADRRILVAAAYLHDMVNPPKDSPDRAKASALSAEAAGPVLARLGFDEAEIVAARHVIVAHSFSANITPETLEARILQDADRLDALGAIGIARTFYIAGQLSCSLFDGDDPFAVSRPIDDRRNALDHFKVKLLGLADRMTTAGGRRLAEARVAVMRDFLNALGTELGHPSPW
ncbi:phosphohydrolase [Kaistia sp. 32K]|uniref:HD domain-containing protein n=1 Tax=Kaistia sp. 32K TaxID=2795690 RepID=UPI0019166832|nr:HD domain-containing protein [Kaistia sp. 32K]BCP56345.1 phosphohydrolase [Kaistia sp. 32K]